MKKNIIIIIILLCSILVIAKIQFLPALYPQKYSEYVQKYSKEYNIDKLLIYSIIKAESNFNEKAKSGSSAIGLMQLMLETAQEMGEKLEISEITEESLYQPEINIRLGTKYFKTLLEKYNNYKLAIIAYNAGMGNLDNWIQQGIIDEDGENIDNIPFTETRVYVKKILYNYRIYQELY